MAGNLRRSAASSSNNSRRGESVVGDCGRRRSSCGYCGSPFPTSVSHGLWAYSITVDDYQDLLDRGWRRSGCFLYKPEMERTCCPSYTIRLRASDFIPSKEQLRVCRRMQRFLDGAFDLKNVERLEDANTSNESESFVYHGNSGPPSKEPFGADNGEQNEIDKALHYWSDQIDNVVRMCTEKREFPPDIPLPKSSVKKVSQGKKKLLVKGPEDLLYTTNIAFQIAATLRRRQTSDKGEYQSENCTEGSVLSHNTIAEKIVTLLNQLVGTSQSIRACNGHINIYAMSKQASLDENVKNSASSNKSASRHGSGGNHSKISERPKGKSRRLEIRLKESSFDPEEYALYRRYQIKVHNDTPERVTESSYRRFLVDTPLAFVPPTVDGKVPPCGFGSFHQQYRIDGQLVAVGVIDILPRCLSSKYLFWDPDFAFLSLGKYSALQEIGWVRESQAHCPSLQYYYLGYYIHSCSKMRYKAAYHPSELLCPLRYQWVPFDIARPLLDQKPYVILSDFASLENRELSSASITGNALEITQDDCVGLEGANDIPMDEDVEMSEPEYESSDDEYGPETRGVKSSNEMNDIDIGKILIGIKESRPRYKDVESAVGVSDRGYLESQLGRYARVVGPELSERMVYSLAL